MAEHVEYLNEELRLIVSDEHTFGTDALLLGAFSAPKRREKALDMGAGCGIIPFFWIREGLENAAALEVQEGGAELIRRSAELNGLKARLEVFHADLREIKGVLPFGHFDLVTMNPPYKAVGTGIISQSEVDRIARHDTICTLEDAALAASRLLRFGGRFCICLKPERLCDAVVSMKKFNIEPKKMRFVKQKNGVVPWLLLLEGKFGGKAGLIVLPDLLIEGELDGYSAEMREIIGSYYDGKGRGNAEKEL